jgi:2'-hydroxyisoflavone reductase
MLTAAERGIGGAYNTVSHPGHTTMGELLEEAVKVTGSDAELIWASSGLIEEAGISPWIELPIWLPHNTEYGGMHTRTSPPRTTPDSPAARSSRRSLTPGRGSRPRETQNPDPTGLSSDDPAKEKQALDRLG